MARRLGAHSDGSRRRYRQRSFHDPISVTWWTGRVVRQMPQPVLEASTAVTEPDKTRPRSAPKTGKIPAETPHSSRA
eukprot:15299383-Heterocapsa_arctica.AAC.1